MKNLVMIIFIAGCTNSSFDTPSFNDATISEIFGVGTITGTVKDGNTGQKLTGVLVKIEGTAIQNNSDNQGSYQLNLTSLGRFKVTATITGYLSQTQQMNANKIGKCCHWRKNHLPIF